MEGERFWSLALSALNSNNQTLTLPIENEPESCVVPTIYTRHSGGQSTQPGPTRPTRALIRQLRPYRTAICQQAGHFSSVFLEIHILFNHDTIYEAASFGNATKVYNVLFRYDSVLETRRTLPLLYSGSPSRIYRTIFCISQICFGSGLCRLFGGDDGYVFRDYRMSVGSCRSVRILFLNLRTNYENIIRWNYKYTSISQLESDCDWRALRVLLIQPPGSAPAIIGITFFPVWSYIALPRLFIRTRCMLECSGGTLFLI